MISALFTGLSELFSHSLAPFKQFLCIDHRSKLNTTLGVSDSSPGPVKVLFAIFSELFTSF